MSRPVIVGSVTAAVVLGVVAFAVFGGSSEPEVPVEPASDEPAPIVTAPSPAPIAVLPEPRSSRSFAPIPEGLDLRQNLPDMADAERVRRRHRQAADLGLIAEDADVEPEGYGWTTDRDGIDSAVSELRGEMFDCVNGYGPEVGAFEGRVVMEFDVSAEDIEAGVAYPQELLVTGADVPQAIQSCMASVYSNMPFEPPAEGVLHVSYPMALSFEQ